MSEHFEPCPCCGGFGYLLCGASEAAETPQSEREEIVKWLREVADDVTAPARPLRVALKQAADAIARGEHLSTRQAPIEGSAK